MQEACLLITVHVYIPCRPGIHVRCIRSRRPAAGAIAVEWSVLIGAQVSEGVRQVATSYASDVLMIHNVLMPAQHALRRAAAAVVRAAAVAGYAAAAQPCHFPHALNQPVLRWDSRMNHACILCVA